MHEKQALFAVCLWDVVVDYQYGNIHFSCVLPSAFGASDVTLDTASSLGDAREKELEFTWSGLRKVQMSVVFSS